MVGSSSGEVSIIFPILLRFLRVFVFCCILEFGLRLGWWNFAVTPNGDDEFEKWKQEVRQAEIEAEVEAEAEAEEEFVDDDGTAYKWDLALKVWVPQVLCLTFSSVCYYCFESI